MTNPANHSYQFNRREALRGVGATSVLGFAGFKTGIESGDVAHGAAISLFMLPVLLVVVVLMLRFIRRREI